MINIALPWFVVVLQPKQKYHENLVVLLLWRWPQDSHM